jgi:hypothetical protein
MRRFLTLICLLCLAVPAGISITGCVRNPAAKYCPATSGYGLQVTAVQSITLQPQIGGISLAYGQTLQAQTPSAYTCLGTAAAVPTSFYTYGTTNNQLVDISPTGNMCAGTWNRNTGGGIADYTHCYAPTTLPSTGGLPYATAYISATAYAVTSNPVEVFVHPTVTSISLVGPQQCLSQGQTAQLAAQACYSQNGEQVLLCAPASITTASNPSLACPLPTVNGSQVPLSSIPVCTSAIGTLSFNVSNGSIGSIDPTTNEITAVHPGTTAITASIAGSGSSAGYFSTCPPASIAIKTASGNTSGTFTQGFTQNLKTTVYDTNVQDCPPLGCSITGFTLTYQSTNPIDISVGSTGSFSPTFPGVASINAICEPSVCNPSPINEIGLEGTGLPITSNPVTITTPGTASQYAWFAAPGQSQYFAPIQLLTGTAGSTVRMPYVPNSMVMDQSGNNLYFGSSHELMVYSTTSNALTTENASVPGVVLAVSPNNSQLLINDQARHVFYLYTISSGAYITFGGMGNAAAWTPDSNTLYVTDNSQLNTPTSCGGTLPITRHTNTLYIYNGNTGWTTHSLPQSTLPLNAIPSCTDQPNTAYAFGPVQTPAITIPSVGAYVRGNSTEAYTWCPSGTVGDSASIVFYPQGDSQAVQTDTLAATTDGQHILGAALDSGNITLTDIGVSIPPTACPETTTGTAPNIVQTMNPLLIGHSTPAYSQLPVSGVSNASSVNQVVVSPASNLAFITYSGTSTQASLPYYIPGSGAVNYVTLTANADITGPLVGAFSPDDTIFFVSTAGDNEIHYINIPTNVGLSAPPTDKQQVSPNLPACDPSSQMGCTYTGSETIVPATAIEIKPRSTT